MVTWHRYYAFVIAVLVLEVAIIGSALVTMRSFRPAYDTLDVFIVIAVGIIAGAIYIQTINRLEIHERKRLIPWYRWYAVIIAGHAMEVAIIGSALVTIKFFRPAYDTLDVFIIIAVGMVAGAICILSVTRAHTGLPF